MNKIIHITLVTFLGIIISGCSTKAYLPTYSDSPDYGTITLIRVNAEQTAPKLTVYAQDRKVASLKNNSVVTFSLPAGIHNLSIGWSNTGSYFEDKITTNLKGRDHHYFAITHYFEVSNFKHTPRREQWLNSEILTAIEMSPEDANKFITEQNLQPVN